MGPRYNQAPDNSGSSEFEMVNVHGGTIVCERLREPYEVEQRTGIRGYSLMGSVLLRGVDEQYAEPRVVEEEFLLFQGEAASGRVPRLTHATTFTRWGIVTVHEPLSVAIMPSQDFRRLVAYNRELPNILTAPERLRVQAMQRSALRTLMVSPGGFEILDKQDHHGWPELQRDFIGDEHCAVAVEPNGQVVVRDFAMGDRSTYVRRGR